MSSVILDDPTAGANVQAKQVLRKGVPVQAGCYTFTLIDDGKVNVESVHVNETLVIHENLAWIVSESRTHVPLAHIESPPLDRSAIAELTILDWDSFPVAIDVLYKRI